MGSSSLAECINAALLRVCSPCLGCAVTACGLSWRADAAWYLCQQPAGLSRWCVQLIDCGSTWGQHVLIGAISCLLYGVERAILWYQH